MYSEILKPIVQSPQLPHLLQELQELWKEEQEKRAAFYDWVTPSIKAEFIEGEVVVHSPVRSKHNLVLQFINHIVGIYVMKNELGYVGVEKVMCRFPRNDYEPDLCFFDTPTAAIISDKTTIFPIPQLVVEVLSPSTEARDRGVKFEDYERNGVQEYWIVDADVEVIEQYSLSNGAYQLQGKLSKKDVLESQVLTGLEVPVLAFFDARENVKALRKL